MKREKLTHIFKKHGVRIAYLFGSQKEAGISFLEGGATKIDDEVDLDIGVVFKIFPEDAFEAYGELYADLSLFFEPFTVDLVFLQETDALFQYEAIIGKLVFSDDELFLEEYEEQVMKRASDLSFKKNAFEKDFLETVKDGYFETTHR
ncbi:MAG: nucleotidyltransferase domain-containing protein [Deltaproteobacteria bacterium]|nr:nucleotidyltransferase domain-containing protein [Deltaproteobacteria bacterium]